jgi:hypothetical protein
LIAVSSLVSIKDRGLIEHLLEAAMYLCKDFYAILESKNGMVIQTDPGMLKVDGFEEFRPSQDYKPSNFLTYSGRSEHAD